MAALQDAALDEVQSHGYILTPGRYVGIPDFEDEDEPFEEKMERLVVELAEYSSGAAELDKIIRGNLRKLGYASKG